MPSPRPPLAIATLRTRRGFSLIELLIVIAIIMVIAGIGGIQYDKANQAAREMAARKELDALFIAQTQFHSMFGKYAASLRELGPPTASESSGAAAAGLISQTAAEGVHNGYRFTLTATADSFAISATPTTHGRTGRRSFFIDQTRIVRQSWSASDPANAQSEELK